MATKTKPVTGKKVKILWWALFTTDSAQSSNRHIGVRWQYDRSNTDHFSYAWYAYYQGQWWREENGDTEPGARKELQYTAPAEATKVRLRIKPISKTHTVNNKEVHYWTNGEWVQKDYEFKNNPPEPITQTINVEMDKTRLTASISGVNPNVLSPSNPNGLNATQIEFEVCKNNKEKYLTTVADIPSYGEYVECAWDVDPGQKYKIRARAKRGKIYGQRTDYTENVSSVPSIPENFRISAQNEYDSGGNVNYFVYAEWDKVESADSGYTVEYSTDPNFDTYESVSIDNNDTFHAKIAISNENLGHRWYFRAKAVNDQGTSNPTDSQSIVMALKPAIPTTWSNTINAIVDEQIKLYWNHNSLDNSYEELAWLHFAVYDARYPSAEPVTFDVEVDNVYTDPEDKNKTQYYIIDRNNPRTEFEDILQYGGKIKWSVQTKGIGSELSDRSIEREIKVYLRPTVTIDLLNNYDMSIQTVSSFPFYIHAVASPLSQIPISYNIDILSRSYYETTDEVGKSKIVNPGDVIYSKYYDPVGNNKHDFVLEMSPYNIDLEPNSDYTVRVMVAMDSGLSAISEYDFSVLWDELFYDASANVYLNPDTLEATIQPYCYQYSDDGEGGVIPELVDSCLISVYRKNNDGSFTEIIKDVENSNNIYVLDPHPTLDYMRYRIIAKTIETGSMTYNDIDPVLVNNPNVVIQWGEDWEPYIVPDEDYTPPKFSGSMLKIPYNINVSDSNNKDVSLVEYIGREHPVSYYGTQLGTTSEWSVEIPAYDKETLYGIRRLMNWKGDVYVREPNGSGYWANISASYSITHNEVTIPVNFSITRVEGGV